MTDAAANSEHGTGDDVPALAVRLRLDIAYDGTAFSGWSAQPGLRTVQGELEAALAIIFRRYPAPPSLTVAGRTDAGVHALGQVAHIDLSAEQFSSLERRHRGPAGNHRIDGPGALQRRLNGIAGVASDIHVVRAQIAAPHFDARFSALWRRYEYRVSDALGPRNPLERNRTVWYPARLDLDAMNEAAESLLGLHDWAAYCKPREFGTTIRALQEFRWRREPDGVLVATVTADAFCHSMVRALTGGTIAVGEGRFGPERLVGVREGGIRSDEFKFMPAKGLALVEVGYPADGELGARALKTKRTRPPLETASASIAGLTGTTPTD